MEGEFGSQLTGLKARAEDILKLLTEVNFGPYTTWPELLGQYKVLAAQFYNINEELDPVLGHFVPHPKVFPQDNPNLIPHTLRTKLLPEIEEDQKNFQKKANEDLHLFDTDDPEQDRNAAMQERLEVYNNACDKIEENFAQLREEFSFKIKSKSDIQTTQPASLKPLIVAMHHGVGIRVEQPVEAEKIAPVGAPGSLSYVGAKLNNPMSQQTQPQQQPLTGWRPGPTPNPYPTQQTNTQNPAARGLPPNAMPPTMPSPTVPTNTAGVKRDVAGVPIKQPMMSSSQPNAGLVPTVPSNQPPSQPPTGHLPKYSAAPLSQPPTAAANRPNPLSGGPIRAGLPLLNTNIPSSAPPSSSPRGAPTTTPTMGGAGRGVPSIYSKPAPGSSAVGTIPSTVPRTSAGVPPSQPPPNMSGAANQYMNYGRGTAPPGKGQPRPT